MNPDKLNRQKQIDDLCNEFETSWTNDSHMQIGDILKTVETGWQDSLLKHLIGIDLELRSKSGDPVSPSMYDELHDDARELAESLIVSSQASANDTDNQRLSETRAEFVESKPALIGPYRIVRKIGQGGMGVVWLAEQVEPIQRQLAIKIIRSDLDLEHVIHRFESERKVLALLDHPNITRIVDAGQTQDGRLYCAMEFVEGQPLTDYCDGKNLSLEKRIQLFLDVCSAIQHAHQKGVIHRDLKPNNILVTEVDGNPVAKIIDFGLAKATESETDWTKKETRTLVGQVLGTLCYMSPEQAGQKQNLIDTRTDIYSLGVILYELLTGSTPINSDSFANRPLLEILQEIQTADPERPSIRISKSESGNDLRLQKNLARDLDWVVMKSIEKDITRRYSSTSELAADLERFLDGQVVQARPPSAFYRLQKTIRRNRVAVIAATLIGLSLVGGVIGTSVGWFRANDANQLAQQRLVDVRKAREDEAARAEGEKNAKLKAEKQLKQIRNSNSILRSIFSDLNVSEIQKGDDPIEAVLAKRLVNAAKQLKGDSVGSAEEVAELQTELSKTLVGLGYPLEALELNRLAFETIKNAYGPDAWETVDAARKMGKALMENGKSVEAIPYFEDYAKGCVIRMGPEDPQTLSARHEVAVAYTRTNKIKEAIAILEEIIPIRERVIGAEHKNTLTSRNVLGHAYDETGQFQKAIDEYEKVLVLRRKVLGEDAMATLVTLNNLSQVYGAVGNEEKNIEMVAETLRLMRKKFGEKHPNTQTVMFNLANSYRRRGDTAKAEPLFAEAHRLMRSRLGEAHPYTMAAAAHVADAQLNRNETEPALSSYRKLYDLAKRKLGTSNSMTEWHIGNLARAEFVAGNHDRSFELYRERIELCKTNFGEKDLKTLRATIFYCQNLADFGKPKQALPIIRKAQEIAAETLDAKSPLNFHATMILADCLSATGKPAEAIKLFRESIGAFEKLLGTEDIRVLNGKNYLAQALISDNQNQPAVELYRDCLKIRKRKWPNRWETFNQELKLGLTLLKASSFEDADQHLHNGMDGIIKLESMVPPSKRLQIESSLDKIIARYEQAGRSEAVAKWQNRKTEFLQKD